MNFAPTEQPDNLPEGRPAELPVAPPEYIAPVQPVTTGSRRSRRLVAAAVLAAAVGVGAVAVGLTAGATPATPAPTVANARGVLLGADTGTWTPPNGGSAAAPDAPGAGGPDMFGGPAGFGPGGMGPAGRMGGPGGFGSITITSLSLPKLTLTTADGWTRTIDTTGATVTNAGQTVAASTLTVGESITFDQTRQSDGSYTITAIRVVLPHVDGTVQSVAAGTSITVKQRDGTTKDIAVNGSTTYKLAGAASSLSAVTVGAQVDAQGTTSNGTFTAALVTIQPAIAGGTVTGIAGTTTGTTISVKMRDGSTLEIKVDASTKYQVAGKTTATLSDIAVNTIVMAEGTRNADGSFSATVVRAFTPGAGFGPGMRGDHGWMPGSRGTPGAQPAPTPAGTTN